MITFLIVLHVIICVLLVVAVLLQFGKGAEMGAVMGGGASQAVFSSSAKGNFMTKLTSILAIGFMVNSIVLTTLKSRDARSLFSILKPQLLNHLTLTYKLSRKKILKHLLVKQLRPTLNLVQ